MENQIREAVRRLIKTKQIARWKLDNPFERWLSFRADDSRLAKKAYVLYYKLFDRAYYQGGLSMIERTIQVFRGGCSEQEKRELTTDMIYSLHRFGADFSNYFMFDFPNCNTQGRDAFITDKLRYAYYEILNPSENIPLFDEKNRTYELFKQYFGREVLFISDKTDFEKFSEFVRRHPTFIKKPFHNSCGRGVEKLSIGDDENERTLFEDILSKGPFLVETLVRNHPTIRRIYPNALSTLRIPTIRTKKGVEFFGTYIRLGQGGGVVDNVGSGGIAAVVDIETGLIETPAYDNKGNKCIVHPDTGEQIVGLKIPQWDSAKELAKELSEVVPSNRYVGWDLALTEKGWIMIEGNARGDFESQQFCDRVGKRAWLEELIQS